MLLLPQTQEQIRIEAGQATTAVDGYMTAPAQGNVQLRPVGPWTAMVDKQALVRETELAAPIAPQHRFAMSAKALLGVPAPVAFVLRRLSRTGAVARRLLPTVSGGA